MLGKKKQKPENKFASKRKYHGRAGMPQTTLKRLEDLHELLQCDPDPEGYVVTTYEEIFELTKMDSNILTIMVDNGMVLRRLTGSSPKFKYKWDTIKPNIEMASKLVSEKAKYVAKLKDGKKENEDTEEVVEEVETPEAAELSNIPDEVSAASSALMDYIMKDGVLIIRVDTKMIDIDAKSVIKSVMKAIVE